MTAAVLGLVADGKVRVRDAACIRTSFPRFVGTLRALGATIEVENQYKRVVREEGNPVAWGAVMRVFSVTADREWRGLGVIPRSGLALRDEYAHFDALRRFPVPGEKVADPKVCQCGEVLRGALKPTPKLPALANT